MLNIPIGWRNSRSYNLKIIAFNLIFECQSLYILSNENELLVTIYLQQFISNYFFDDLI